MHRHNDDSRFEIEHVFSESVEREMKFRHRGRILAALLLGALLLGGVFVWSIGALLVSPANHPVGPPPASLRVENVAFSSGSGATIHGWFVAGQPGKGAIVLLHGVHADRTTTVARAEFLSRAGYSVLLFDFQGHGESIGRTITFGFLESRDAAAAVEFLRQKLPAEKIGVIGISMGAAAALLSNPPLPVEAMVLEECYPTIYQATEDRMIERFGFLGRLGTPLLIAQLKPRLGISVDDLKPIVCARRISIPKFFIAGGSDHLTTAQESKELFEAAAAPKQFWLVAGAAHVDLHKFARTEYEQRVLAFLAERLEQRPNPH